MPAPRRRRDPDTPPDDRSRLTKFLSGGGLNAIIMFLIAQATFSIVYQIINNEQQAAAIIANQVEIKTLRDAVTNLQTPLAQVVLKLEGRVQSQEAEHKRLDAALSSTATAIYARIDSIDRSGTRGLEAATSNMARFVVTLDRNSDRLLALDKRVGEVENRAVTQLHGQLDLIRENIKRIDDQLTRTVQALDATYNTLQDHLRQTRGRSEIPSNRSGAPSLSAQR